MKKTMAVLGAVALAVGAALAGGVSASATDAYPTTDVVTAVWSIPGGNALNGHHFDAPQTLVGVYAGNQLNGAIVPTTCGSAYQVDVYVNDVGTKTLLTETRVLNGPNNPYEHLIAGGSGVAYKLVQNEACPPPVVKTPVVEFTYSATCGSLTLVTTTTDVNAEWYYGTQALVGGVRVGSAVVKGSGAKTTVIPFAEDENGGAVEVDVQTYASTEQDILPAGWGLGVSHLVTVDTDCVTPPEVTPPPVVPPTTPKPPVLAYTGVNDVTGWLIPFGAGLFLLGGAGLLLGRRRMFAGK
jgi:hypothetical protein